VHAKEPLLKSNKHRNNITHFGKPLPPRLIIFHTYPNTITLDDYEAGMMLTIIALVLFCHSSIMQSASQQAKTPDAAANIDPKKAAKYIDIKVKEIESQPYWPQLKANEASIARNQLDPYTETNPGYFLNISTATPSPYAFFAKIEGEVKATKKIVDDLVFKHSKHIPPVESRKWSETCRKLANTLKNSGLYIYIARIIAIQLTDAATHKKDRLAAQANETNNINPTATKEAELRAFHSSTVGKVKTLKAMLPQLWNNGVGIYEIDRCKEYYPELAPPAEHTAPQQYLAPQFNSYCPPYLMPWAGSMQMMPNLGMTSLLGAY